MWSDLSNLVFTCVCIHMWKSPDIFRWQFLPLTMFETGSLLQLWSCQDSWPRSFERFCCLHLLSGLPVLLCLVFSWHAEQMLYTVHLLACNIVIFFFLLSLNGLLASPYFFDSSYQKHTWFLWKNQTDTFLLRAVFHFH